MIFKFCDTKGNIVPYLIYLMQTNKQYKKEWKNHLDSQTIFTIGKAYCPEHRTYEKTEFMTMGFGQKVLARRCITQEGMFDLIPIEEGF